MSDVASQKRIVASVLKCGVNRVWFDPSRISDIENAISREDLRGLVTDGAIKARQKKGVSRGRARARIAQRSYGHRKGPEKERVQQAPASRAKPHGSRRSARSGKCSLNSAMPLLLTGTCTASSTGKRPADSSEV
jgi:ribosomal protein L19E